jgi:hypothetical protein
MVDWKGALILASTLGTLLDGSADLLYEKFTCFLGMLRRGMKVFYKTNAWGMIKKVNLVCMLTLDYVYIL